MTSSTRSLSISDDELNGSLCLRFYTIKGRGDKSMCVLGLLNVRVDLFWVDKTRAVVRTTSLINIIQSLSTIT